MWTIQVTPTLGRHGDIWEDRIWISFEFSTVNVEAQRENDSSQAEVRRNVSWTILPSVSGRVWKAALV